MTVGDVLREAWDLYKRFFWRFVLTAAVVYVVLDLLSALPRFANIWIGGFVAHSITTPFIALTGAVLYFRLARFAAGVDPANPTPH